ncbi:hypothetical protein Poli38472_010597 [Pythium oligandrum]|uniref:Uncharacterized protein n=1 Tax=Pythium oligandrum TaxID=41045 RepID=A0A8K1C3G1_PYTOL|nr:hypothetical protein Poli38472_010597 [Pythium oligandrum]|eukprot:TMW55715.1 hypothetical protein Poli38472_010597 [Pythium oligandrum]
MPDPVRSPDDTYAALQSPQIREPSSENESPLDRVHWLSRLTFWWAHGLLARGYKQPLQEDDVWDLPATDRAAILQRTFDRRFHSAPSEGSMRIYRAMWHSTKRTMALAILLHLIIAAATMLQPLLIKSVLEYIQNEQASNLFGLSTGYGAAGLLTVTSFVGVTSLDYGMYLASRAGMNARMIVVSSVYQKLLRLSSMARQTMSSGDIITLASVDSERLYDGFSIGLWAVLSPLIAVTCCILIGVEMGVYVGLVAAACCVCILGYAVVNSRQIGRVRREILQIAAERVKVTNEVLQGIRMIKMYAWEESFSGRVGEIRAREVKLLRKYDYLRVQNLVMLMLAQTFMTAACLLAYVYLGNTLTVSTAFTLLALANACRTPFGRFSYAVVFATEARASLHRIANFLAADEIRSSAVASTSSSSVGNDAIIEFVDADFAWGAPSDSSVPRLALQNINLSVQPGTLTIVVGAVGSGKSSLVSAMLGEMHRIRGTTAVRGSVAYASQQPWIQHNSVRENILFGKPLDQQHYDAVISACQMRRDLDILENGDATEIGERGINLSGGQKARVSLARVMYRRESDVVVLDDPLSALDVHVANAVFFDCVLGLVKSKTRVLVLNAHYHLLPHADRILVMSDGQIVGDGSYAEVRTRFPFLSEAMVTEADDAGNNASTDGGNCREPHDRKYSVVVGPPGSVGSVSLFDRTSRVSNRDRKSRVIGEDDPLPTKPQKALILDEDRALGSVTWRTYISFLELSGWNGALVAAAIFVVFVIGQCGLVGADYFIKYWSDGSLNEFTQSHLLWMYIGIVVAVVLLWIFRAVIFTEICIRSTTATHTRYFHKILVAPINTFFDVTPIGRILNRFSRDLDQIDNPLLYYALGMLMFGTLMLSIFVVCAVTTPTTLILYVPLFGVCYYVQAYFLVSSRELKRLDGITRSPFLNLVGETINGIESIRSFHMTKDFSRKCHELLDNNAKFFFMYQTTTSWFAMRVDWLVTTVVTVVSFTCVASKNSIGSANAGIALTYAVQLSMQFQRVLTLASMTENHMTSFERIAHYASLDEEGDSREVITKPEPAWPQQGHIEFSNVFLRYRDGLEFVLRGVNFTIQPGHKVGVCGRTGSGKSTLMNALFRTVELAQGSIRIDDVDIASISLHALRSKLTIIPQDPVLFSGTLRDNLDPFNDKTDEELFGVLRKVHLMDDVSKWGAGLSHQVTEKGDNLSVGQRQLICIARALLRDSRIIVLDEATANVDQELDRLIQVAVKENFVGRTSLTIAHRLETIADSDRILVMDHGVVAEYDSPSNLLVKPNGIFASLMESTQAHS